MSAITAVKDDEVVLRQPRDPLLMALWATLVIVALVWIAPFVFIVITSLKSNGEVMATSAFAPPQVVYTENYTGAWSRGDFATTLTNSVVIAFIKVPLGLLISAMAAYALARIKLRRRKLLLLFVLFGTMIPFQVMLAPLFTLVNSLGLINTYVGIILPYLAFGVSYQDRKSVV